MERDTHNQPEKRSAERQPPELVLAAGGEISSERDGVTELTLLVEGARKVAAGRKAELQAFEDTQIAAREIFAREAKRGIFERELAARLMEGCSVSRPVAAAVIDSLCSNGEVRKNWTTGLLTPVERS